MTMTLFSIRSGEKIEDYRTEDSAKTAMRTANAYAGWSRQGSAWRDGVEMEWAAGPNGEKDYAPYGITEAERWDARFRPEFLQQRNEQYATQEEFV